VPGLVLARAGFTAALTVCLSTCCLLCRAVHVLQLGGSERERNGMCVVVAQKCFRWLMLAPCFWIQISGLRELQAELKRASEEAEGAPYVLANHNSPLDSLLFAAVIPPEVGANLRSMVKAVLLDAPLFGSICADVGHFPVFYKRPGEFPVHKELQAVVTERVDEFLGAGGGLFLFPEGTLNRADARRLGSFRRGGFTAPMKYRRAIWGCLNVGCDDVWPVTAPVGGWPARVDLSMIKICDDASRFADSAALAAYAQSRMQAELDRLYELREDCRA
jgi:1-acyl-sn-glycerol-3-phosphate acyltransferase